MKIASGEIGGLSGSKVMLVAAKTAALGAGFSPGWLLFELAWEISPPGFTVTFPLLCFWIERTETDYSKEPWPWGWSLLRLTIWKTEFRLDLDLNIWGIGLTCVEFDDLGIYVGPFNIQIETGKMFDVNFPPGVPGCFSRRIVPLIGGHPGAIAIRLETMRTTLDRSGRWPL